MLALISGILYASQTQRFNKYC